jgi:hypothetical protein
VRQPDEGVRPGAARNLGVTAAIGEVLVFLDADMVPSPTYVREVSVLPTVAPEALVVGTRQHRQLEGWTADQVRTWLRGGCEPDRLDDPGWLADGYRRTRDLIGLDLRSYQFVIGAVTAMHRSLFDDIGGFDARIDVYGAEDWDLAHRAVQAGGLLAHVDAIAYHDGPDWRGRVGPDGVKNPERLHLVTRIPSRTDPVLGSPPFVRVTLDGRSATSDACVACVVSVLDAGGLSTVIGVVHAPGLCPSVLASDPRVHWDRPPPNDPHTVVDIRVPVPLRVGRSSIDAICHTLSPGGPGRLVVADSDGELLVAEEVRARRRFDRWTTETSPPTWEDLFGMPLCWAPPAIEAERLVLVPDLAEVFPR